MTDRTDVGFAARRPMPAGEAGRCGGARLPPGNRAWFRIDRVGRVGWRAALILSLLAALAGCPDADVEWDARESFRSSPIPMMLHGMPLIEVTAGAKAEAVITRLHGREVTALESYVGRYQGGGAEATLYVSRVTSDVEADSLTLRMARSIGTGTPAFAHHTRFRAEDLVVHAVLGQGEEHFFWARGPHVSWLSTDHGMARPALAGLLEVDMEALPAPMVIGGVDLLPPPDSLYHREPRETTPSGSAR